MKHQISNTLNYTFIEKCVTGFLMFLLILFSEIKAQVLKPGFKHLTVENDLSQSRVQYKFQNRYGCLWLYRRAAGLPISKKIAGRHKGIIRAGLEEEGNGSTFILKISSTKSKYRHWATMNTGMEKGSKVITLVKSSG